MGASVRQRTRLILSFGFGSLLLLIAILGVEAYRRTDRIYRELASIQDLYRSRSSVLNDIQADLYKSAVLVRDYLLDRDPAAAAEYRNQLMEVRGTLDKSFSRLQGMSAPRDSAALGQLGRELESYWSALDPLFDWTPEQKAALGVAFLRKQVLPRRTAVLSITRGIDVLNAGSLTQEGERVAGSRAAYQKYLIWMFTTVLCLAISAAIASVRRISTLEKRAEEHMARTEDAERQLRWLSQRLVHAQEEERKSLSRELHDEVGQSLTAIRMVFGNLERSREEPGGDFDRQLGEGKDLAEQTLQTVRNLALGLRPSMLDDLGLEPALKWQAREFSRRSGIPVDFRTDGSLEAVPDRIRTCIYRIVQESLTNCARHARAKNVFIDLHGGRTELSLTVRDDGVGFEPGRTQNRGLGLIGIEERVRELDGTVELDSHPGKGTVLNVVISLNREGSHEQDPNPAGG
jgi:signal transduction histidine kinase